MNPGNLKPLLAFLFFILISKSCILHSEPLEGVLAKIQILDKITARVKTLDIKVNDSNFFETLNIEIYACFKNPPEEIPEDFVLLKIYDNLSEEENQFVYQGWMISSSPAVTPLEHPIYDLWLIECKIDIDS
tara:strand:+ start:113 stop:508 length:396 start_codon:yes stop_codon:yes gene_type:complete